MVDAGAFEFSETSDFLEAGTSYVPSPHTFAGFFGYHLHKNWRWAYNRVPSSFDTSLTSSSNISRSDRYFPVATLCFDNPDCNWSNLFGKYFTVYGEDQIPLHTYLMQRTGDIR